MKIVLLILMSLFIISCDSEVEAELLSAKSKGTDPRLELFGMTVESITSTSFSISIDYGNDANRSSDGVLYYCNETQNPMCDPYNEGSIKYLNQEDNAFSGSVSGLTDPGDSYNILFVGEDSDGYLTDNEISTQITLSL